MMINPSNLIFMLTLISGTLISVSSSTWLGAWMGLEMNLLSFIPLMNKNKTPYESEAAMKYFLIQAIASAIFLAAILMAGMMDFNSSGIISNLLSSTLLMKMGAAPLHFWFPGVMEGIDWFNCFILMTWQKIAPFVLISYKMSFSHFFSGIILFSVIVGAIGGLNQSSIRKLMAYSSISHLGWMISAMLISKFFWVSYFLIYSLMNMAMIYLFNKQSLFHLSQSYSMKNNNPLIKFTLLTGMLSLGGLPPFLGFLPKWMIIQNMVYQGYIVIIVIMIMTTLLTLYFYLRLAFSAFLFMKQESLWESLNKMDSTLLLFTMISIGGIPIMLWMFNY